MQVKYGEKFGQALTDVHHRLMALEEKMGMQRVYREPFSFTPMEEGVREPPDLAILNQILNRLEKLEEQLGKQA